MTRGVEVGRAIYADGMCSYVYCYRHHCIYSYGLTDNYLPSLRTEHPITTPFANVH